jgi:hypothetical protein
MVILEYPLTRPVPLTRSCTAILIVAAAMFIGFLTLFNIVAVGYEVVPIISNSFEEPYKLWYERFVTTKWLPSSWTCQPTMININDSRLF